VLRDSGATSLQVKGITDPAQIPKSLLAQKESKPRTHSSRAQRAVAGTLMEGQTRSEKLTRLQEEEAAAAAAATAAAAAARRCESDEAPSGLGSATSLRSSSRP
jgi:hypothetical protein